MKMKAVLCCMALMGVLSFDTLHVQAASCSHKIWQTFYDVKTYYYEEDGHYGDCCTSYICADCGYQYWGDDMEYRKMGEHQWGLYHRVYSSDKLDVYEADCITPECPITDIRTYFKTE